MNCTVHVGAVFKNKHRRNSSANVCRTKTITFSTDQIYTWHASQIEYIKIQDRFPHFHRAPDQGMCLAHSLRALALHVAAETFQGTYWKR